MTEPRFKVNERRYYWEDTELMASGNCVPKLKFTPIQMRPKVNKRFALQNVLKSSKNLGPSRIRKIR